MTNPDNGRVSFGFRRVGKDEKRERIDRLFSSVSRRYDLMNDLMSFGLHRFWKRFAVASAGLRPGERVLDAAGGSGDAARLCLGRVGARGSVVLLDTNREMIEIARNRDIDCGLPSHIHYVQGSAERPPFRERSFDCVIMAFGLRNVADAEAASCQLLKCIRWGGRLIVLEFSRLALRLAEPIYRRYCLDYLPWLGDKITGNADAYRYLGESILVHPSQERVKKMLAGAGFGRIEYFNLAGGIAAVHRAYRL